jgi:copper(I)-binding protein
MRRPDIKKFSIAVITAALALSLTACAGAGPNAATRLIKQVTDGKEITIDENDNKISVRNLLLVATEDGSAVVVGTFFNKADQKDTLVGISVGGVSAEITGTTELIKDQPIRFEGEQATSKAVFNTVGAEPGRNVPMTLTFERAGKVTANVIIRDKRDDYANVNK